MTRPTALFAVGAAALALAAAPAAAEAPKLPKSMVWTAYDLGSVGYAEASGIANAFQNRYGTRVRIIPSGTSIGRLLPVTTGKAIYGFLANGAYFAAEGTYDFAAPEWGPQDIRIVIGRIATVGFAVAGDIGVNEISDLKGKRIGFVKGNPSVNVKNEAYLAFGGLTMDDIKPVWFGSYGAMKTAVIAGQLDAFGSATTSANMREIEASPRGLTWPNFSPDNQKGWEAMTKVISFAEPRQETVGAALSEEKPAWLVGFRYPMVTTYARTTADEAYAMLAAMEESYDDYKNTTGSSKNWTVKLSARPAYDAPAHEGTVRYMKEKGYWRAEDQAWQDKRLARLNAVLKGWDDARASFEEMRADKASKGEKLSDDDWLAYWNDYRSEKLN